MKNILKLLISIFFLYERHYLREDKLLKIDYSNIKLIISFRIQRHARSQPLKAIFAFSLCAFKIIVPIVGRKVLVTYLVTFTFRGTHFSCNRKGRLNGKILNNKTRNNNYTLQCINMITKYISDILISDKIGIY